MKTIYLISRRLYTKLFPLFLLFIGLSNSQAQTYPLVQNIYGRTVQSLDGKWHYIIDQMDNGRYAQDRVVDNKERFKEFDYQTSPTMNIPGDWNTQVPQLLYYEGTLWLSRNFQLNVDTVQNSYILYFGAVNYNAVVYVNGKKAGEHTGGFVPFNFDITGKLQQGANSIAVRVNNVRREDGVPALKYDWFNYGGITRDVLLAKVPRTFIHDYALQLKKGSSAMLTGYVKLNEGGANQTVTVDIPELKISKRLSCDASGYSPFEIKVTDKNFTLWSPENPKLYAVTISSTNDKVADEIGFRTIETQGRTILLNGKPIFLKGISIHEESAYRNGRIGSEEDCNILLSWAKELGCNFARLAHYPHNELMVKRAERMGILLWEEIPNYWGIQWANPETYQNSQNQENALIERDKNRANVIIWSVANETTASPARNHYLFDLIKFIRSKDDTRLISLALLRKDKSKNVLSVKDTLSSAIDVISVNSYVGWYEGSNERIDNVSWEVDYDKPLIISEFGGGSVYGLHGDNTDRWTEEYQAELYRKTLKMIDERMPKVSGITPWILKDFRSPLRQLPNYQDGFNRKGVISDQGQRKQAFYVLQKWYKQKDN